MRISSQVWQWATVTALILAGGSGGRVQAAEPGKLLVWINGDKGYNGLQKVGDAFATRTGVKVTVEHPEDAPTKFAQAAAEGKGPDIWIWPHDRVGEWKASGPFYHSWAGSLHESLPWALGALWAGGRLARGVDTSGAWR